MVKTKDYDLSLGCRDVRTVSAAGEQAGGQHDPELGRTFAEEVHEPGDQGVRSELGFHPAGPGGELVLPLFDEGEEPRFLGQVPEGQPETLQFGLVDSLQHIGAVVVKPFQPGQRSERAGEDSHLVVSDAGDGLGYPNRLSVPVRGEEGGQGLVVPVPSGAGPAGSRLVACEGEDSGHQLQLWRDIDRDVALLAPLTYLEDPGGGVASEHGPRLKAGRCGGRGHHHR